MTFDPNNFSGDMADPGVEAMPVESPRRAASLTLRTDEVREARAASMEAANKSLADALRVTYRLLQVVMIALVGLFVLSGFQQVNQSESGIRVELGKIKAERLEPGFQFALPYPLGEIIKVTTGSQTIELDDAFWPGLSPEERRRSLDDISLRGDRLEPGKDGALLTADSGIAHVQLSIVYTRSNPASFVKNLYQPHEQGLVRAAVKRAAVQVAATVGIDDLLKPGGASGDQRENSVESRIRQSAQNALDQTGVGLEVNQVLIRSSSPPQVLRRDFNQVQIAQSNAGKARDEALGERSRTLNGVAGSAHQALLDLITDYENALELGDEKKADGVLAQIDSVLNGEKNGVAVQVNGREYAELSLSGEVSQLMSEATQYRGTVVQMAQRSAETFAARLQQYRASPSVFLTGALTDALASVLSRANVEVQWLPEGLGSFELLVSPDPQIQRALEAAQKSMDVENNPRVQKLRRDMGNK